MIKVKMLVSRTDAVRNSEIEVDADEAKRMVAAGQAEYVRSKKTERAIKTPKAEKAVK